MGEEFVSYGRGEEGFHFMALTFSGRSGKNGGGWRMFRVFFFF